jgi:hypothetical protein
VLLVGRRVEGRGRLEGEGVGEFNIGGGENWKIFW